MEFQDNLNQYNPSTTDDEPTELGQLWTLEGSLFYSLIHQVNTAFHCTRIASEIACGTASSVKTI